MPKEMSWSSINAHFYEKNFFTAVKKGRTDVVKSVLVLNPHWINIRDTKEKATPLIWAAYKGHTGLVKFLLSKKSCDIDAKDKDGDTALFCAVKKNRSLSMIKALLKHGARSDISCPAHDDHFPIFAALRNNNPDVFKLLIKHGAQLSFSDRDGDNPLHYIAYHNKKKFLDKVPGLKKGHQSYALNKKNNSGDTPLTLAIERNNPEIAKQMILGGANPNTIDRDKATPLMHAAWNGMAEITSLLIEKGADIYAVDKDMETAFDIAKKRGKTDVLNILNQENRKQSKMVFNAHRTAKKLIADLKADVSESTLPKNDHDELTNLIQSGKIEKVRNYFNSVFWKQKNQKPTWEHLQIAMNAKDKPMMKLLVTWDASPTTSQWEDFQENNKDTYIFAAHLLRQAGVRLYGLPHTSAQEIKKLQKQFEQKSKKNNPLTFNMSSIPSEWTNLLTTFHNNGAEHAGIAGGALRDLYHNKPIKDVDLFVFTQGSQDDNYRFIVKMFKKSGIKIHNKPTYSTTYFGDRIVSPKPVLNSFNNRVLRIPMHDGTVHEHPLQLKTESWHIIAGENKTDYNIVFVGTRYTVANTNIAMAHVTHANAATLVMDSFDIGLCQIMYDAHDITYTDQFKKDSIEKTLTHTNNNKTSLNHLQRVMKKYPDHTLCDDLQIFFDENKPQPRPRGTNDTGPR